ncbi:MAG TPA: hypothetical protein VFW92_07690 [Candidatus Limnocylindrales bacterium]|nr:hypothetical protein [Candidatus Limnocylindrales bacterium]
MALPEPLPLDQLRAPRWTLRLALLILVALALLTLAALAGSLPGAPRGTEGAIWLWRWSCHLLAW